MNQQGVTIITGASSGIGKSIALELSRLQFPLALIARDKKKLEAVQQQCRARGTIVEIYPTDLGNIESYSALVDSIRCRFKEIAVLINSAGIWEEKLLTEYDPRIIDQMIIVNLTAVIHLSRLIAPHLRRSSSGAIITIGSVAATRSYPKGSVYCATKHAVRAFSQALFLEERQYGTKVCIIHPGVVDTPMHEHDTRYTKSEMLMPEDVAQATKYILQSSQSCIPTEIILYPQQGR